MLNGVVWKGSLVTMLPSSAFVCCFGHFDVFQVEVKQVDDGFVPTETLVTTMNGAVAAEQLTTVRI